MENVNKSYPKLRFPEFNDNWELKRFGEIYSFRTTNSLSRENLNYDNGDVKNIHYGDIHTKFNSLFDIEKELVPYINSDVPVVKIPLDNYCKEGDLIIADASEDYNDIGKSIEILNLNNEKVLAGLHTFLARPDLSQIKIGFNNHLMKSQKIRFQVMKIAQGSKVLSISTGRLSNINLNLPSLPEQSKLATFLTSVDTKINQLTKKKQLLEQYKKGVIQQLFSQKIRFKDSNGNDFSDWEEKRVSDIFKVTRGNVLSMTIVSNKEDNINKYPVYSSQTKNKGLSGFFDKYLYENSITWTTDGANAGDVNYRKGKFYCTNVCGVLISENGYANLCISEILNLVSRKYVSYVGNPKLMNNVMAEIPIYIPSSIEEQNKISNFITTLDDKLNYVALQLEKTKEFKKGLLQQMFV